MNAGLPLALGALLAAASPLPASAQSRPPHPAELAAPDERDAMIALSSLLAERTDARVGLERLEAILAGLDRPTELRGLVQLYRASALHSLRRTDEARLALTESLRLMPGHSAPLLLGVRIETFSDRPVQAADHLLRAAEIDSGAVRGVGDFEISDLVRRLDEQGGQPRADALAERLIGIGWRAADPALRSRIALRALEGRVRAGDLAGARALIPRLTAPQHVRTLLIHNRYRELWPELERWGGPRQRALWPGYLAELRGRWEASRGAEQLRPYLQALQLAGHDRTIARAILPALDRPLSARRDYGLIWVYSPLGDTLSRLGRWDEIDALAARMLRVWRSPRDVNRLNIIANRARFRLGRGDAAGALRALDEVLEHGADSPGAISAGARTVIHSYRACALHELGRPAEAAEAAAIVLADRIAPVRSARLLLCMGRHEAAREVLLRALDREATRDEVVEFAQLPSVGEARSDYGRRMAERHEALRTDPVLVRKVLEHGRILDHPGSAGAPEEAVPL